MKIIIWLGNPGKKYECTRHNIWFMMVDAIFDMYDFDTWKTSKFDALTSEGIIEGEKVILVKPTTFMNLSGQAISKIVNFYKLDISKDILVISDDIDMEFAKVRMRAKGSHGGQNGLRDSIQRLGTDHFYRLKIGIGRHGHMSVSDWVLSKFTASEQKTLSNETYKQVEEKIEKFLRG